MKHLIIIRLSIIFFVSTLLLSCDSFDETEGIKEVEPISIQLRMNIEELGLVDFSNVKIGLQNSEEGIDIKQTFEGSNMTINGLIPGVYNIQISGVGVTDEAKQFILNGGGSRIAILEDNIVLEYDIKAEELSPLIFKEIYYSGSRTPSGTVWFRDQFYEIYNNGVTTIYLDNLYFGNLYPASATNKVPLWPAEDGEKYAYAQWLWRIPGEGTDYPLEPGESVVLAQFAVDQRVDSYNPLAPIDCSIADFEIRVENPKLPDGDAPNMEIMFYQGNKHTGTTLQYLTPVGGGAYIIFQIPEGETYDPVNDLSMKTKDLAVSSTAYYAKVPREWIKDVVEAVPNESSEDKKRIPVALDAGMTTVGGQYVGKSVARKVIPDEDGVFRLQDTNNSTEDFETGLTPEIRRYGVKMPIWNHTLQGK